MTWFDRNGASLGTIGPDGQHDYADFRLSPDDTRLAASLVDPKLSLPDVWLTDLLRGGTTRLTFGPAVNASAIWTPQGDRISYRSTRRGLTEIYSRGSSAGGTDQALITEDVARAAGAANSNMAPSDWSPDGRRLVFSAGVPSDLWLLEIGDQARLTRLLGAPSDQTHGNFSPDGRLIALTSNESGRYEVSATPGLLTERSGPVKTGVPE